MGVSVGSTMATAPLGGRSSEGITRRVRDEGRERAYLGLALRRRNPSRCLSACSVRGLRPDPAASQLSPGGVMEHRLSAVLSEFARTLATDFPIQGILD